MTSTAFIGARIFDGRTLHDDCALIRHEDGTARLNSVEALPRTHTVYELDGGTLLPGFVDLQVNGGGGVMFNDETSVEGLEAIAAAHRSLGTTAFLPTLITDTPCKVSAAIDAVRTAIERGVEGIAGLHLEGPHLAAARTGAHDPSLLRAMSKRDERQLLDAAHRLPNLMITIAPECVSCAQISRLSRAGVIVSLGHSDCSSSDAIKAFEAGASCVTHLFNAMSQLGSRSPGLVGAALACPDIAASLIADGIHVDPVAITVAMQAKAGHGGICLVTDAMATAGSDCQHFMLNDRLVRRSGNRLTLEDGTLAGAHLDLATAISVMVNQAGLDLASALRMATSEPAALLDPSSFPNPFGVSSMRHAMHLTTDYRVAILDWPA